MDDPADRAGKPTAEGGTAAGGEAEDSEASRPAAPRHLSETAKSRERHRIAGRRLVAVGIVLLVVAAAIWGGTAGWEHVRAWLQTSGAWPASDGASTDEAASSAPEVSPANGSESDQADDAAAVSTSSADDTSDDAGTAEASERKVGDHDAPTAEDEQAMATLAESVTVEGAPDGFESSSGYRELLYQVVVWQRSGYGLGFALTDIDSGASVSYNTEQVFYPASSIKAPYVCSLYQELVETGTDQAPLDELASTTIVNSDNDAYHALHRIYGQEPFRTWVAEAGVGGNSEHDVSYVSEHNYPFIDTQQLDAMWSAIYRYCTSGTEPSMTLAGYLSERTTSPIATAVGDRYSSWGKAGWFYDTNFDCAPATVDAGVVFAEKGPYQVVMMSDAPGALDALAEVAAGMDSAAADLAG